MNEHFLNYLNLSKIEMKITFNHKRKMNRQTIIEYVYHVLEYVSQISTTENI